MVRVLIVEDDNLLSKVYQEVLSKNGFEVNTATTGPMGLELIKSWSPNLVLLDVMIPGGMNGFDILEQVKADPSLKAIPIVVISNLDSEKRTALSIGATDYIFKANTSIDEVVEKVRKYTSESAQTDTPISDTTQQS